MTIEMISNSKILIVLGGEDMRDFELEYDTMSLSDPHSRKILSRLLSLACTKTGISTEDKNMVVEALPYPDGCLILLTLEARRKPKIYKVKRKIPSLCVTFDTAENLIRAVVNLKDRENIPDNSLYYYDNKYYLIVKGGAVPKGVMYVLREFAEKIVHSNLNSVRIEEKAKLLINSNAHQKLAQYF